MTDGMLHRMRRPQQLLLLAMCAPTFGASKTNTACVVYNKPVFSSRSCSRRSDAHSVPQMLPSFAVVVCSKHGKAGFTK